LSELHEQVENLAVWLARRYASDAVDAIDDALREPRAIFQIVTICK
jgi:hypothetical protein